MKIDLIVRDTCRLRPGIPGLTESVRVVGRFLEHARILYFYNGGDEEYCIGSADLMRRNLEARVEVHAPVESPELRLILDVQLADTRSVTKPAASSARATPSVRRASSSTSRMRISPAPPR